MNQLTYSYCPHCGKPIIKGHYFYDKFEKTDLTLREVKDLLNCYEEELSD